MWLYLMIFLIPVGMYIYTLRGGNQRNATQLAIYIFGLALFVGLSDMFGGYDRYIYGEIFDSIANVTDVDGNYVAAGSFEFFASEPGWTILNILISFFTDNRYIFILTVTLLTYTFLFVSLRRYASNYPLAVIIFLGLWFFFLFTYLRQVLGATLVWLSIPYIIKKKFWKFTAIVFVAWMIHKSAIMFFPVYFLSRHSYARDKILIFMFVVFLFGVSPIPNAVFDAYGDMSQVELQEDYSAQGGLRIAYLIEAVFFLWIMLRNYTTEPDLTRRVMFNTGLLFCAVLLFFIRSENGGRLSWYYVIGIICTLTNMVTLHVNRRTLAPLMIVVCLVLYMRIYNAWQALDFLYPYKTFLTNGYRLNDQIRNAYEYDYSYDNDKFYRDAFRIKTNFEGITLK